MGGRQLDGCFWENHTRLQASHLRTQRGRRVTLHHAESAKRLQLFKTLLAQQIFDRLQDRARVRFDRFPVISTQRSKIECRHDRGNRCATRLMTAYFQPVTAVTQMVRVVNGPSRQPAQTRINVSSVDKTRAMKLKREFSALQSVRRPAAIDNHARAGHQRRRIGSEEDNRTHQILNLTEATEFDFRQH